MLSEPALPDIADDDRLAALAKALAHPARLKILALLARRSGCIGGDIVQAVGLALGALFPDLFRTLAEWEIGQINLEIAVLIWVMIYPMMVAVTFAALARVHERPKGQTAGCGQCLYLHIKWECQNA